jgi:hypothetical protein
MKANPQISKDLIYKLDGVNPSGELLISELRTADDLPAIGLYRLSIKVIEHTSELKEAVYINFLEIPKAHPFVLVEKDYESKSPSSDRDSRGKGPRVTLISLNSLILENKWGFTVTCDDNGSLYNGNSNRKRDGWEGWTIEIINNDSTCFISRNMGYGQHILGINDNGHVDIIQNRILNGYGEFEFKVYKEYGVVSFRRVKSPRYYLGMDKKGY